MNEREIKFRARDKRTGEWWYCTTDKNNIDWNNRIREPDYFFGLVRNNILDSKTLSQYTGLKDKNGEEIYEGDILKEHPNKSIGVVEVDKGNFGVDWGDWEYPEWDWNEMAYDHTDRIEIIGNIYENPEAIGK